MRRAAVMACALVLVVLVLHPLAQQPGQPGEGSDGRDPAARLAPTDHPRLPRAQSQLWFAPGRSPSTPPASSREIASALKLIGRREFTRALATLTQPALQNAPLASYATFYAGIARQERGRHEEALRTFRALQDRKPIGYLAEAASLGEAESLEALGDYKAAVKIYERLSETKTTAPDGVLMRLGRAAKTAGELQKAGEAFARVYYEFPL